MFFLPVVTPVRVAQKLRSLRIHPPRLCRSAVLLRQTNVLSLSETLGQLRDTGRVASRSFKYKPSSLSGSPRLAWAAGRHTRFTHGITTQTSGSPCSHTHSPWQTDSHGFTERHFRFAHTALGRHLASTHSRETLRVHTHSPWQTGRQGADL